MTLASAVLALWLGSEALILVTHAAPPSAWRQDRLSGVAVVAGVVLTISLASRAARISAGAMGPGAPVVTGVGVALVLAGVAVRWYSVLTLGRFFTTRVMTRADQTVVQSGPYRFIRHPSYTGALVTLIGVLLLPANWLTLPCFLLVLPGLAYRIYVEEKALVAALGEPYREYMRRTKRLVPFIV